MVYSIRIQAKECAPRKYQWLINTPCFKHRMASGFTVTLFPKIVKWGRRPRKAHDIGEPQG